MLRSLKDLDRYAVTATDGDIGHVANFLFDDQRWVVRYLVADTARLFELRREVLISPISFREIDWNGTRFHLGLSKSKVRESPDVDTALPVSRQYEREYYRYYGYPYYWGDTGDWGAAAYPDGLFEGAWAEATSAEPAKDNDPHLRSANEVRGYHVEGRDGAIGHIHDFVVDDRTWKIRYLVLDTSNWWLGKKVLVAPGWVSSVVWPEKKVHVDLSRQAIKDSPPWTPEAGVNREYETRLYDFYGRPVYWDDGLPIVPPLARSAGGRAARGEGRT